MDKPTKLFGGKIWIDERGACSYECSICGYTLLSAKVYEVHVQMAHQHELRRLNAEKQAKELEYRKREYYSRREHVHDNRATYNDRFVKRPHNEHQNDNRHRVNDDRRVISQRLFCTKCEKPFNDLESLRAHMAENHQYVCKLCPSETAKTYDTEKGLWSHQRSRHATKFPYRCNVCPRAFAEAIELSEHQQSTHTRRNNVQCDFCPKVLMSMYEKTNHIKKYHANRRYHCLLCNEYSTTSEINLRRHSKEKHAGRKQPRDRFPMSR